MLSVLERKERRKKRTNNRISLLDNNIVLVINKTNKNFYVQIIDKSRKGKVLFSLSTLDKEIKQDAKYLNEKKINLLGNLFIKRLPNDLNNIKVVFNRGSFKYTGLVEKFAIFARQCLVF